MRSTAFWASLGAFFLGGVMAALWLYLAITGGDAVGISYAAYACGSHEEGAECVRAWVEALGGWAGVAVAIAGFYFLRRQIRAGLVPVFQREMEVLREELLRALDLQQALQAAQIAVQFALTEERPNYKNAAKARGLQVIADVDTWLTKHRAEILAINHNPGRADLASIRRRVMIVGERFQTGYQGFLVANPRVIREYDFPVRWLDMPSRLDDLAIGVDMWIAAVNLELHWHARRADDFAN